MKQPKMEIVKFHNEDVIATSALWSAAYTMGFGHEQYHDEAGKFAYGVYANDHAVWFNSPIWQNYKTGGLDVGATNPNFLDNNTLDGTHIAEENLSQYLGTKVHYNYSSYVGGWQNIEVYNVWKTCTGDENCTGNCHAN